MAIFRLRWNEYPPAGWLGGITTIGNFDGVHLGHQELLKTCGELSSCRLPVVAVTFDPHPVQFLYPDRYQKPLMKLEDRCSRLQKCGADHVMVLQTTTELVSLSPLAFFETILHQQLQIRGMVEGFNFRFGHNREGDNSLLEQLCQGSGIPFREVPPLKENGIPISTSLIRKALLEGNLKSANHWLNTPFTIEGKVIEGARRGRTIGFPTANLGEIVTILPANGVYGVKVRHREQIYRGAANIGPNPTFGEFAQKIEVFLLDFQGDLYGENLQVDFWFRIRDTMKFSGVDALVAQMNQDVEMVRRCISLEK